MAVLTRIRATGTAAATAAAVILSLVSAPAVAQKKGEAAKAAQEQFFPVLSYRTGPYGPNGAPWVNGFVDYLKVHQRTRRHQQRAHQLGGMRFEHAASRRRMLRTAQGQGRGACSSAVEGVTFALTDKAQADKIPIITVGYGRSDSADGEAFPWNFPILGSYPVASDILIQHLAKINGGFDKLRGKKIALVYHDSPYGREPIPVLQERAKMHRFEVILLPVTHPGVEQKAAWLQIRQQRPDYVLLWGWGVMNSAAIREAVATGFPRDRMYGVWWAAAEPDVLPAGADAKGYHGLALQHGAGQAKVHDEILSAVHAKGQGTGPKEEVGSVLYTRGMVSAMVTVEAVRRAQERYGKRTLTGPEIRWGLENLALDQKRLDALGFAGVMRPVSTSCKDHMGAQVARLHTWDGSKWTFSSDWYEADMQVLTPMIRRAGEAYVTEKKLSMRSCAEELTTKAPTTVKK